MGSNVERIKYDWWAENNWIYLYRDCKCVAEIAVHVADDVDGLASEIAAALNAHREAIEADREEGIEVEVVRRWDNPNYAGTKEGQLQVRGLYGHGLEEGPYTLIKREAGDSDD